MGKIAILGAGSWGTALAKTLAISEKDIVIWGRDQNQIQNMKRNKMNSKYLADVQLPENISYTHMMEEAVDQAKVIVLAASSQANRGILESLKGKIRKDTIIVNISKGLERDTNMRASEICQSILPENPFVVLSGPSHAEEVAINIPTTLVAASKDRLAMEYVQNILSNEYMRVYTNEDVLGVELGGALKNIIALGTGILVGLGYGDNTKAALMTRGMTEIVRLGTALGAHEATFFGLSGMGDLIVTCTSEHSRNRRAGVLIGQGKKLNEISQDINMVVEGITATKIAYELSKEKRISMPIVEKMYEVLYENKEPNLATRELMTRKTKNEIEDLLELHGD